MAIGRYRRPKRYFAISRRYHGSGQNALELIKLKRMKPQMLACALAFRAMRNDATVTSQRLNVFRRALTVQVQYYMHLTRLPNTHVHLRYPARLRTILSFQLQLLETEFRFSSHEQLTRLLTVLRLPPIIRFPSGNVMSGEECMLLTLRRLVSSKTL